MEFKAALKGDLEKIIEQKNRNVLRAVNRAVTKAGNELKKEMIGQTQRARLGYGLSKSWKVNFYNKSDADKFTKALVYTKSPKIMEGFENAEIRKPTRGRKWIAIPSNNVPKAPGKKRYTPETWKKSFPVLYFAQDTKGKAYLVGQTIHKTNKRGNKVIRKTNSRNESEAETVVYFFLVKQTRHTKKLNFEQASKKAQRKLKDYISQELGKLEKK
ncbi:MAG TPA: hypothetical protein DCL21_07100 [Alphaproteobacteria bacterium]|nr:hypothetical protein [Alphaproteobacteria bacterium]